MTTRLIRRMTALAAGASTVLFFAVAGAQNMFAPVATPACAAARLHSRTGLEMSINGGIGGLVNESSSQFTDRPRASDQLFAPGVGVQVWSGYRFRPWVSLGGLLTYQNNQPRDLPAGTTAGVSNSMTAGGYARVYVGSALGWHHLDPWFSVGISPFSTRWTDHETANGPVHTRVTAVSIPVTLGLDYNLSDTLAAGFMIQGSPWVPIESCANEASGPMICTTGSFGSGGSNVFLFAGLGLRMTMPN